jgi:hypothetical protein
MTDPTQAGDARRSEPRVTLGARYRPREKTAQLIRMIEQGHHPKAVANVMGMKLGTVRQAIYRAYRRGELRRVVKSKVYRPRLCRDKRERVFHELDRAALERGMTCSLLVERLLVAVVEGDLIDAVLDDG